MGDTCTVSNECVANKIKITKITVPKQRVRNIVVKATQHLLWRYFLLIRFNVSWYDASANDVDNNTNTINLMCCIKINAKATNALFACILRPSSLQWRMMNLHINFERLCAVYWLQLEMIFLFLVKKKKTEIKTICPVFTVDSNSIQ